MRNLVPPGGNYGLEIGRDPLDCHGMIKDRGGNLTIEEINEAIHNKERELPTESPDNIVFITETE